MAWQFFALFGLLTLLSVALHVGLELPWKWALMPLWAPLFVILLLMSAVGIVVLVLNKAGFDP